MFVTCTTSIRRNSKVPQNNEIFIFLLFDGTENHTIEQNVMYICEKETFFYCSNLFIIFFYLIFTYFVNSKISPRKLKVHPVWPLEEHYYSQCYIERYCQIPPRYQFHR